MDMPLACQLCNSYAKLSEVTTHVLINYSLINYFTRIPYLDQFVNNFSNSLLIFLCKDFSKLRLDKKWAKVTLIY